MGSSNFQQWNPAAANQESDAAYTADSMRSGGAGFDENFPSPTANKLFYQLSTFISAFAQALANKGYAVSDANLPNLTNVLANVLTNADTKSGLLAIPYSPNPVFDCSQSNGFQITLTGNVVGATITNAQIGQRITFVIIQDGVGNRSFTWPGNAPNGPVVNPGAGYVTVVSFVVTESYTLQPDPTQDYSLFTLLQKLTTIDFSIGATGYLKLGSLFGGLIIQWGTANGSAGGGSFNAFAIPFPSNVFAVIPSPTSTTASQYNMTNSVTRNGFNLSVNGSPISPSFYIAVGN